MEFNMNVHIYSKGCWDCYHKCHRVGDEFTHGCKTTQCMAGGFSKTISNREYNINCI